MPDPEAPQTPAPQQPANKEQAPAQTPAPQQPAGKTYTEADLEAERKRVETETRQKIEDDAKNKVLEEQGNFKELLTKEQQERQQEQNSLRETRVELAAYRMADEVGIPAKNMPYALRLVDPKKLEFDKSGQPTNLAALLKDIVKDLPALGAGEPQQPQHPDGGPTNPPRKPGASSFDPKRPPRLGDPGLFKR